MKTWVKVVLGVLMVAGAVCLALFVMFKFYGIRFQTDGGGIRPMVYVDRHEQIQREIEKRASEDRKAMGPAVVEAAKPDQSAAAPPAAEPANSSAASAPWPEFYGRRRDGVYRQGPILMEWPEKGLKEIWRRPVGGGYASMAIAQGKIYTIEQRRDKEALVAYDFATGREIWADSWAAFFRESMGGDGPRSTPTWDDGRVYALGAEGELRCADAETGKLIWHKNILREHGALNLQWGMSASPLVVGENLIVLPGSGVAALNKRTGGVVWRSLDDPASYAAPIHVTLNGQPQVVVQMAKRVAGLNPADGKLIWEYPWQTDYDINAALPVVVDANHLILSAGYGHGSMMLEIGASGAKQLWTSKAMKAKFNNVVLRNGIVYGLDEGILAAMDARTGEKKWKGGRYGYGQILLAGDYLIVLTESGELVLVKATPDQHEEIAKFQAMEGRTWNVPAIADGKLIVRNTTEMVEYQVGK